MTPTTLEECKVAIENLRGREPDFDELYLDAVDPATGQTVARLYLQFREPFTSYRQEGYAATHQDPAKTQKWQYSFAIDERDTARLLREFNTKYFGMKLEPSISSSKGHERYRDEQMRQRAERQADEDALLNARIEGELIKGGSSASVIA